MITAEPTPALRRYPPPVSHAHALVNGLKLHYRAAGPADAPALVLLHGFPSSSHMFRGLIPLLSDRYRVIAPDHVGFGHSDAPPAEAFDYSFDNLAKHTRALLDQLGVGDAIYYLHDYGGPIGLRLAIERPASVRGLVIQNANAYLEGVSPAAAEVFMPLWERNDDTAARRMLLPETTRLQYTAGARRPQNLSPDAWLHDQALLDRPGSAERQLALFRDYRHNVAAYERWQAYFREHQPRTLVAWGRGDPFFTVAGAQAYRRDLRDIDLHLLDSGHFALEEDAALVAALIQQRFPAR